MKTQIIVFSFLLIIISSINNYNLAQVISSDSTNNICEEKEYVFDLYFINGYAFGYQVYSNSNSEIRLLLDLSASGSASDEERKQTDISSLSSDTDKYSSESNRRSYSISLTSQYLMNLYKSKNGVAYWGIGPRLGFNWRKNTSAFMRENEKNDNLDLSSSFSVGLTALIGIRGNLNNAISLYAEAQLTGTKSWGEYENESIYDYENSSSSYKSITDSNGWGYSLIYSRIGIRFSL